MAQDRAVNHRRDLARTISETDPARIATAYHRTTARAPQRRNARKNYLVGHDGLGGTARSSREKTAAKALFNCQGPLLIGDESVTIVDYEVPLRTRSTDREVGEVDLLGIGDPSCRPWIIEMKVWPNKETPLKALYQGLRYSAMLDANRHQLSSEIMAATHKPQLSWPGVIVLAADSPYWEYWDKAATAGDWLPALRSLAHGVTEELGIEIIVLDLGNIEVDVIDGAPQLRSELALRIR